MIRNRKSLKMTNEILFAGVGWGDPVQEESSCSSLQEEGAACLKGGDTGKVPGWRERLREREVPRLCVTTTATHHTRNFDDGIF